MMMNGNGEICGSLDYVKRQLWDINFGDINCAFAGCNKNIKYTSEDFILNAILYSSCRYSTRDHVK